jgi:hypothetical protein
MYGSMPESACEGKKIEGGKREGEEKRVYICR